MYLEDNMATVFDAAHYITTKQDSTPVNKLQSLLYFCQCWSLDWDNEPIFKENILAWSYGAYVKELYLHTRGKRIIYPNDTGGNLHKLKACHIETIDEVLKEYGELHNVQLVCLIQSDSTWKNARRGIPKNNHKPNKRITQKAIKKCFSDKI